jgi:hypothetical protein
VWKTVPPMVITVICCGVVFPASSAFQCVTRCRRRRLGFSVTAVSAPAGGLFGLNGLHVRSLGSAHQ